MSVLDHLATRLSLGPACRVGLWAVASALALALYPAGDLTAQANRPVGAPAGTPAAVQAESTYHVEVIIFEGKGARDEGLGGAPPARGAGEVDVPGGARDVGRLLGTRTQAQLQLRGLRERLAQRGYTVLAHAGWTQTASTWGTRAGLALPELGLNAPGLEGTFLLERGNLLHFGMNLTYTDGAGQRQQLNELRRIRFNDRNYYDNPSLGVIAVVSPGVRPR